MSQFWWRKSPKVRLLSSVCCGTVGRDVAVWQFYWLIVIDRIRRRRGRHHADDIKRYPVLEIINSTVSNRLVPINYIQFRVLFHIATLCKNFHRWLSLSTRIEMWCIFAKVAISYWRMEICIIIFYDTINHKNLAKILSFRYLRRVHETGIYHRVTKYTIFIIRLLENC